MSTSITIDDQDDGIHVEKPGAQLALERAHKGYSIEYVASKLHLRVRVIELLEADDYHQMPEPVFIKGYLRAYARLLGVPSDPLLALFNRLYSPERKVEKALWQTRRETNKAEYAVRLVTSIFALAVLVSVTVWWQANKGNEPIFPTVSVAETPHDQPSTEIRLTDLSKMRSLLSSPSQSVGTETEGG